MADKHPIPFYNLPDDIQHQLEEDLGLNGVDMLKDFTEEELAEYIKEYLE